MNNPGDSFRSGIEHALDAVDGPSNLTAADRVEYRRAIVRFRGQLSALVGSHFEKDPAAGLLRCVARKDGDLGVQVLGHACFILGKLGSGADHVNVDLDLPDGLRLNVDIDLDHRASEPALPAKGNVA